MVLSVTLIKKKKTENEIFKIISPENLLKFLVNKDTKIH